MDRRIGSFLDHAGECRIVGCGLIPDPVILVLDAGTVGGVAPWRGRAFQEGEHIASVHVCFSENVQY